MANKKIENFCPLNLQKIRSFLSHSKQEVLKIDKIKNKRGQVTIFIIIAIVLVAAVVGYFIFKGSLFQGTIPASIEPVYNNFLSCLEEKTYNGIDILESQAGYIELPNFEPGSNYMPFSSQLDFLGNAVPYWYYVSGNNIQKEQIPSLGNMQTQLGKFVEEKITDCRFDSYYEQGFEITKGKPTATVSIRNDEVQINLNMDLSVKKGEDSSLIKNHKVLIKSKLGTLYNSAKKIYEKEQKDLFLENYAVDTLNLYAPVDGVELTCSPKTWIADDVFKELQDAIEINTLALKNKGSDNDYFKVDTGVSEDVNFITSKKWAYSFEVEPSQGNILIANPVGNQPGLGILGFCYVPYHFVYDVKYPILVQVSAEDEIFQFPVAVVIQGNKPRQALDASAAGLDVPELCKYKNTPVNINTYDTKMNRVETDISYECFGTKCNIGETVGGSLKENFPQCVNGYILARADGFEESKFLYSTTASGSVDIILDKLYTRQIILKLDGVNYNGNAIISFSSDKNSKSVSYPEQKEIELSEGQYEVQVQIYKNSTLRLEATTTQQCVDVPQSGFGGLFGMTKEKCFDIEIPAQVISNALAGGGKQSYYILESELQSSSVIEINAQSLPTPVSLEQLQDNYISFDEKGLEVYFR